MFADEQACVVSSIPKVHDLVGVIHIFHKLNSDTKRNAIEVTTVDGSSVAFACDSGRFYSRLLFVSRFEPIHLAITSILANQPVASERVFDQVQHAAVTSPVNLFIRMDQLVIYIWMDPPVIFIWMDPPVIFIWMDLPVLFMWMDPPVMFIH